MKVFIRRFKSEDVTLGFVSIQVLVMSVVQEWNKSEETCCLPEIHFFCRKEKKSFNYEKHITCMVSPIIYHL